MRKHYTDAELLADIQAVTDAPDPAEVKRDAYFADPANADEIEKEQARIDRVIANYKLKKSQGVADSCQKSFFSHIIPILKEERKNNSFVIKYNNSKIISPRVEKRILPLFFALNEMTQKNALDNAITANRCRRKGPAAPFDTQCDTGDRPLKIGTICRCANDSPAQTRLKDDRTGHTEIGKCFFQPNNKKGNK